MGKSLVGLHRIDVKEREKMIYLVFAIVCSGMMAIFMRVGEDHGCSMKGITVINYIVAVILSFALLSDKASILQIVGNQFELGLGLVNGILFLVTLVLYQWNIRKNGVPLAVSFARLGVLIPMVLAMVLFGEMPSSLQWIGVGFAVFAILLINIDPQIDKDDVKYGFGLVILLVVGGMTDMMNKVFDIFAKHSMSNYYLFYTFLVALILSIIRLLRKHEKISVKDMGFGILVGGANYGSSLLFIQSVIRLPAFVVFPMYSVGTILFVNFVNLIFLHESVSKREYIGMGLVAVAIVFLNWT